MNQIKIQHEDPTSRKQEEVLESYQYKCSVGYSNEGVPGTRFSDSVQYLDPRFDCILDSTFSPEHNTLSRRTIENCENIPWRRGPAISSHLGIKQQHLSTSRSVLDHCNLHTSRSAKMTTQQGAISKRRKFVADGVFYAELNEFFQRELAEEGYSGVEVRVTPTVTDISTAPWLISCL